MKKIFAAILLSTSLLTNNSPLFKTFQSLRTYAHLNRASFGIKARRNAKKHWNPLASALVVLNTTATSTVLALTAKTNLRNLVLLSEDEALQYVVANLSSGV